jgi:DNA polymerase elongation subunit (family B)
MIYDIETYPNCFTLAAVCKDAPFRWSFEISDFKNDALELIEWLAWVKSEFGEMIGFNNVRFDYPVLHMILQNNKVTANQLYQKAMAIIQAQDKEKFSHMVFPSDRLILQLDLYKIHHFDNKARATSLKALEFNMKMENISDLPFPVGTVLNQEQIKALKTYNAHDCTATKMFYEESLEQIQFRRDLTAKHSRDFMNHSDVKIGKEIFQMELENAGVSCYSYGEKGRTVRQTLRSSINLGDCVPKWIIFNNPEFQRICDWFKTQVITETKGALKDVVAKVGGLDFVFGTGGLHASVSNEFFQSDNDWMILDVDVTSLYPSIAIEHNHFPEHLGIEFVNVYRRLREQRISFKKGTAENTMLKFALNGVYGASSDPYSVFFDPLFTMKITIGGQMMLSLLAEKILGVPDLRIIQVNTDGITVKIKRADEAHFNAICETWEKLTSLKLEHIEYSKMAIRDVNSYIAVKINGEVKRKGAYEYELDWSKNFSALVVAKVAEQVIVYDNPLMETLTTWGDKLDFMCRVKVPRSSKLVIEVDGVDYALENMQRYYVAKGGGYLAKIMPPLAKNPEKWRRIGVESGWTVCPCNKLSDGNLPIDYSYYQREIEKLCLSVI